MFNNKLKFRPKAKKIKTTTTQSEDGLLPHEINLTELECGNSAKVINLQGSHSLIGKLEAMGILPGTIILKKSAIFANGPIIVEKGALQFALGYDLAQKIVVEPIDLKN